MSVFNIYFGTVSGDAENFARSTRDFLVAKKFKVKIRPLDKFVAKSFLEERIIIVFCSNIGEGEPPEQATKWWEWFSKQELGCMRNTHYTVFGLGSKAYPTYNQMGNLIDEQFKKCGASEFAPIGNSDSSAGKAKNHFEDWLCKLAPCASKIAQDPSAPCEDVSDPCRDPTPTGAESATVPQVEVVHASQGMFEDYRIPLAFVAGTGGVVVGDAIRATSIIIVVEQGDPLHQTLFSPPAISNTESEDDGQMAGLRCVVVGANLEALTDICDQLRAHGQWKVVSSIRGMLTEATGKKAAAILSSVDPSPVRLSFSAESSPEIPFHQDGMEPHVPRRVAILNIYDLCSDERLKGVQVDVKDYEAGGNIAVRPHNRPETVQYFAENILRIPDRLVNKTVVSTPESSHAALSWIPLHQFLREHVDLEKGPSRSMMRRLEPFLSDDARDLLAAHDAIFFGSSEVDCQLSLQECFQLLGNPIIPAEFFLGACEQMKWRFYSIASSSAVKKLEFAMNVLKEKLPCLEDHPQWSSALNANYGSTEKRDRTFYGLCTNFLANLKSGDHLTVSFRNSAFEPVRRMIDSTKPLPSLLMIGNGTGIGPFVGLSQEMHARKTTTSQPSENHLLKCCVASQPKHNLLFGCRTAEDWIYNDEMKKFEFNSNLWGTQGVMRIHVAFSRSGNKRYVQHELETGEVASALRDMCQHEESYILLCGSPKMVITVQEVIAKVQAEVGCHMPKILIEAF